MAVQIKALGYVVVDVAGTPELVTSSVIRTPSVHIQAATTNSGLIYVLDLDENEIAELSPGSAIEITGPSIGGIEEELQLNEIKLDAATNGDKAAVSYFARR